MITPKQNGSMNPKFSDIFYFLSPKANTTAKIFHFFFFFKIFVYSYKRLCKAKNNDVL